MWFLMQIILCLIYATLDAFSIANGALSETTISDNANTVLSLYCSHFVLVVPRSGKGQLLSCSCEQLICDRRLENNNSDQLVYDRRLENNFGEETRILDNPKAVEGFKLSLISNKQKAKLNRVQNGVDLKEFLCCRKRSEVR
ncbi:hypothetical protein CUMW_071030 [Citrus unshiu]|nr:hypothetical protein CUMW_071030 [Citrus unshiu]